MDALFEAGDANKALKHFAPTYPDTADASLKRVSLPAQFLFMRAIQDCASLRRHMQNWLPATTAKLGMHFIAVLHGANLRLVD